MIVFLLSYNWKRQVGDVVVVVVEDRVVVEVQEDGVVVGVQGEEEGGVQEEGRVQEEGGVQEEGEVVDVVVVVVVFMHVCSVYFVPMNIN